MTAAPEGYTGLDPNDPLDESLSLLLRAELSDVVGMSAATVDAIVTRVLGVLGPGAMRIARERARQLRQEGFSAERDRDLFTTELARASQSYVAAALYAQATGSALGLAPDSWPFADEMFKPSDDPVRNLEKAGALLAAELDRLTADRPDGGQVSFR